MTHLAMVAAATTLALLSTFPSSGDPTPPPAPWSYKPPKHHVWRPGHPPSGHAHSTERPASNSGYRSILIQLVNHERRKAHCPAVRPHPALNKAAQNHSAYMARTQTLSHTEAGGPGPGRRMRAAGYRAGQAGENLVAGPKDPAAAVRAWMNSAPHRASLLTCPFRHAGVGRESGGNGPWWTLLLAAPR
ncbi:CAP domain-containing protein [Streptomyces sp. NPDC046261]|uniref:CAP domain-containing protein n=1 Tax=Streptomyces sp. NPDC046261 TaxID=3157200 RepID=UPI0033D1B85C